MLNNTIDQSEESVGAATSLPDNPPTPINIWLVDDNRQLRSTLMEILDQCEGLRCKASFHSPNAVLSALASKAGPDVILLDIQMGDTCGLDAIRPIKTLSRATQVLMFTTFFDGAAKKRALTDGASGFLLKHFTLEQILASIHQALKNPAPHLKRSRHQNRTHGTMPNTRLSTGTPCRPQGRFRWLKQCLDLIHYRQN